MISPRSLVELVRAPAALSTPGDVFAGAAAAGRAFWPATPALAASSACLYWAGMALNDYADRQIDAAERPQRPIPSGRVPPRFALTLASGLTAAGLGISAAAGGRRAFAVAAPLAATVWAYDLLLKQTPAGPATMALARSLDVLLGAGADRLPAAAPAAAAMGAHTLAVTTLSRSEVTGSSRCLPAVALAATAGVTVTLAGFISRAAVRGDALHAVPASIPLAAYAASVGRAQLAAVREPTPRRLQQAVGAGILGMLPLQSALTSVTSATSARPRGDHGCPHHRAARNYGAAAAVLAAFPVARRLSRKVSPT